MAGRRRRPGLQIGQRDGSRGVELKLVALIPARGGSKRLPGKNTRNLGGKPLLLWTIESARHHSEIADVIISTDADVIAEVGRAAGATVPWLRPRELATDDASSVDVALHALDWYEESLGRVDGLLLLQPTSPFRRRESVARGIEMFAREQRSVVGVSPARSHPMRCYRIAEGKLLPFFSQDDIAKRSQELPAAYVVNGAFYLVAPDELRSERAFYGRDSIPLLMDGEEESLDIDTDLDWKAAELTLAARKVSSG